MPISTENENAITPWLTPREAAARAKVGKNLLYHAIKTGKLKAARLGARNDIRIHAEWLDAWIAAAVIVNADAPGPDLRSLASPFPRRSPKRTRS